MSSCRYLDCFLGTESQKYERSSNKFMALVIYCKIAFKSSSGLGGKEGRKDI